MDGSPSARPKDREIEVYGRRVAALEWGRPGDHRVLALHGWLDNAASFDRLAPRLPGLHLVALDLPGHGRSDHFPGGHGIHFVDWMPEVAATADALGWERFSLLGHSMGAGIASLLPSAYPGRVERLVLVEGLGPLSAAPEITPERMRRALREERWLAAQRPRVYPDMETAVKARTSGTDLDASSARILVERATEASPDGLRFRHDPLLKAPSRLRLTEEQVRAFLAAIDCPVLAIRASDGWPFPAEYIAARMQAIPNLQAAEVPGGHHVHLADPGLVAPLIAEFFRHASP